MRWATIGVLGLVLYMHAGWGAASPTGGLHICGSIRADGVWSRVILEQTAPLRNGACTYARRLAVRCVRRGTAASPWRCRRHPYPNKAVHAIVTRRNPWKLVTVFSGRIGEEARNHTETTPAADFVTSTAGTAMEQCRFALGYVVPALPGRKRIDDRKVLTGILFVLQTGIPWEYLPQEMGCGSGVTCWRRLREWQEAGVWQRLHELLLAKLNAADLIDWSRGAIDSSHVRAFGGVPRPARARSTARGAAPSIT